MALYLDDKLKTLTNFTLKINLKISDIGGSGDWPRVYPTRIMQPFISRA
jgi:hypothetical protein